MSEYWKSTPNYWCKFCKTYVRDTTFERRNHEATGRHQGNIQRSLREIHKGTEAQKRDQQRAKDEVARLNGLVSSGNAGNKKDGAAGGNILGLQTISSGTSASGQSGLSAAAQRKAHAEQLAAMGVKLPLELQKEVTGVGGWETVSETPVQQTDTSASTGGWTLANIKKSEDIKSENNDVKGDLKRTAEETGDEAADAEDSSKKRKVWGTTMKTYPGADASSNADDGDLDVLLSGVKSQPPTKTDDKALKGEVDVKTEQDRTDAAVKPEDNAADETEQKLSDVPPPVVFKKRKFKK